jgi:hypothetical protein
MFWNMVAGMSAYNHNNNSGDKNRQNRDALYHAVMAVLVMINGVAIGGTIRNGADLIKNGYDGDNVFAALLYLLCAMYSGHTAYRIYQAKKKIDNNQNQR